MYIKRHYGFFMTFNWSKKPFLIGLIYSAVICGAHQLLPFDLFFPWQPISILGIAVAFYLGFKNNSSYDRTWEARKIWGAIVNNSRTFASAVLTLLPRSENQMQRQLIHRHIAWLTALRYQLRLSREWEHTDERIKGAYIPTLCEAYIDELESELIKLIPENEIEPLKGKTNTATQLLLNQTKDIQQLYEANIISDYKHVRLQEIVGWLYDEQGKCERIKNFPFPRQYASVALWLTYVFSVLIPFGMLDIFMDKGQLMWLTAPFSALLIWVFFLMEKIGDYSENPFEGTYNDVPISTISRSIEIDLREMLDESDIPEPFPAIKGFQM